MLARQLALTMAATDAHTAGPVTAVSRAQGILDAAWRVLAEDVRATEDHPPFPAATMDGFAVVAADVSPWREVLGVQTAGHPIAVEVTPGTAVRITTGAPVPRGADAVVRVEN